MTEEERQPALSKRCYSSMESKRIPGWHARPASMGGAASRSTLTFDFKASFNYLSPPAPPPGSTCRAPGMKSGRRRLAFAASW